MNWSGYKFYAFPPFRKSDRTERTEYSLLLFGQHRRGSLSWYNTSAINLGFYFTTGSSDAPFTRPTPPAAQETPPNGMSCVRGALSRYKFSEEVTVVLMASWRSEKQKQYKTYLNKWMAFSGERKIAYYSPPLNEALQFRILVRLFNQGLSYSALNTARSVLSAIIIKEGGKFFGTNRVATRFMKK